MGTLMNPRYLIFLPLVLLLIIAVACGDDATATPSATATPVVVRETVEVTKVVEVTKEVPVEVTREVTVVETVVVAPTSTPLANADSNTPASASKGRVRDRPGGPWQREPGPPVCSRR